MRPTIGLTPLYDEEKQSFWMLPGYVEILEQCGAAPMILPLTANTEVLEACFALCDGLLLTGGQDVAPSFYGAEMQETCGAVCPSRDAMEAELLRRALAEDCPVLGICRGLQFLNAALGGTLYQDLPTEQRSTVEHHMAPPYDRAVHKVTVVADTLLSEILQKKELGVNSYHHQGISKLAPALREMAHAADGLIEAAYLPEKRFVAGVQWHPELAFRKDPDSVKLAQAFVNACTEHRQKKYCSRY